MTTEITTTTATTASATGLAAAPGGADAAVAAVDLAAVKARQQATWSAGDYGIVGATLQIMGEQLCEAAQLRPGWRVLDVATGNGGTAIAAARRMCDVVGVDYVPALVEQAKVRAAAERYAITFDVGDAEALPYPDASFDAVTSTLGVMFTADHRRAAAELLRVCRPGGTIALTNWTPDGFIGRVFKTIGAHVPPPPGVTSPAMWGTEAYLHSLFGAGVSALRTVTRQFVFRAPSPDHFLTFLRTNYGPMLKAFEHLDDAGRDALATDLRALMVQCDDGIGTMAIPSDYLEVVATRRRSPATVDRPHS